jgi:hypothetical protein
MMMAFKKGFLGTEREGEREAQKGVKSVSLFKKGF